MISKNQGENTLASAVFPFRNCRSDEDEDDEYEPDGKEVGRQAVLKDAQKRPTEQQDADEEQEYPYVSSHVILSPCAA